MVMDPEIFNPYSGMAAARKHIAKKNLNSKLKGSNVVKPKDVSASTTKDEIESEEFTMGFKLVVLLTDITDK